MSSAIESAFKFSPLAQLIIDPECDAVVDANLAFCTLFEVDLPALGKRRVSSLFYSVYPQFIVFTQEILASGSAWSNALRLDRSAESVRAEITAHRIASDNHCLVHLCIQDADDLQMRRERAEAQQHYSSGLGHWNRVATVFQEFERENQLILDAAGEGIYGVDAEGMTTFMNPAAEAMLGYCSEELAGKSMHLTIHHTHSDGSHYCAEDCPIYLAFRNGKLQTIEDDVFWTKSGVPIDVEYTSTPIKDNGHLVGAVIVFRDITQKNADKKQLLAALQEVETLKNRLELENAYLQEEINSEFNHHQIVGKSPAIQKVIQQIELVAPTDATVLVEGESGTGKELIARAIHELSQRGNRSLIRVNCAAIPSELFESEFFGHARGSFTGATSDRPGRFELADRGTIFLDEVGEIPLHLQGKLLRVLQEQQFERVGESRTRDVDVRVIAATNRSLAELVEAGKFREDLYYRLNVFPLQSVPLRKRLVDIPPLAQHFLKRASTLAHKSGLKIPLSELARLQQYHWPGNIRELENIIERQVILTQGDKLRFPNLELKPETFFPAAESLVTSVRTESDIKGEERRNLLIALDKCQGKVFGIGGAAALLNIKPTTLSSRIKKLNIDTRQFKRA